MKSRRSMPAHNAQTLVYLDEIYIRADQIEPCLQAIQRLYRRIPDMMRDPNRYRSLMSRLPDWSTVSLQDEKPGSRQQRHSAHLVRALTAWRYESVLLESGRIQLNRFTGTRWGCDEMLFQTLAPYLEDNGKVHCLAGRDYWTYLFHQGQITIITGEDAIACQHGGYAAGSGRVLM